MKWELSCVVFEAGVTRVKSGMLGLVGLRGSNLVEPSLLESLGMSVTVLMSSRLPNAMSGVLVSLSKMSSSPSCLSGSRG